MGCKGIRVQAHLMIPAICRRQTIAERPKISKRRSVGFELWARWVIGARFMVGNVVLLCVVMISTRRSESIKYELTAPVVCIGIVLATSDPFISWTSDLISSATLLDRCERERFDDRTLLAPSSSGGAFCIPSRYIKTMNHTSSRRLMNLIVVPSLINKSSYLSHLKLANRGQMSKRSESQPSMARTGSAGPQHIGPH